MRAVGLGLFLWLATGTLGCRGASTDTMAAPTDSAPVLRTGSLSQAVLGRTVSVRGRVTRLQDDSPHGHKLWLDDGTGEARVFIDASTELIRQTSGWRVDDELLVTGYVAKYQHAFELVPRVASDIVKLGRTENRSTLRR